MNQCWNNEATAAVVTKKGEPLGQKASKISPMAMRGPFNKRRSIRQSRRGIELTMGRWASRRLRLRISFRATFVTMTKV